MIPVFKNCFKIFKDSKRLFFYLKLIGALIVSLSFYFSVVNHYDPDLGWHLATGKWIVENREFPRTDEFSFTMPGFEWTDHEWLVQIVLFLAHENDLWFLVILFFTAISLFPFLIWLKRSSNIFHVWIILVAAALMRNFIGVRPQIITFFFLYLVYELLSKTQNKDGEIISKYRWFLPAIFFVWANLHAGFLVGLVLYLMFIVAELYKNFKKNTSLCSRKVLAELLILMLCFLGTLLNPLTINIYIIYWEIFIQSSATRYISEWYPPFSFLQNSFYVPFIIFSSLFLFLYVKYRSRFGYDSLLITAVFFLSFIKAVRNGPLFIVTAVPFVNSGINFLIDEVMVIRKNIQFSQKERRLGLVLILILFLLIMSLLQSPPIFFRYKEHPAERAILFVKENFYDFPERIFNHHDWGGYLIWNLPEKKFFIDGRMSHWINKNGESVMEEFISVMSDNKNAWRGVFKKYDIKMVLLPTHRINNKNFLRKTMMRGLLQETKDRLRNSKTVIKILDYFSPDIKFYLVEELKNAGWDEVYNDDNAVVLYCSLKNCWDE